MALLDKPDLKTGFWLGLGLIGALIVWGLISMMLQRLQNRASGG